MNEWEIDTAGVPRTARLRGVFRLESPAAYDSAFEPMLAGLKLAGAAGYTVDIAEATLMNSSGIRALADLVMVARRAEQPLTFIAKVSVPWQRKAMISLESLYAKLKVVIQ